jgi:hypothetical protein
MAVRTLCAMNVMGTNVDIPGPASTCAIALFDGCNALDVIGFRESIGGVLSSIALVGREAVVRTNLGFIRFRTDLAYPLCAHPQILILPGAERAIKSTRIDTGVLSWINAAAHEAELIVAIGNGADILRAADVSPVMDDRLIRSATGTEAAALLTTRLQRRQSRGNAAHSADLKALDGVWSTIQTYLNNQRPPYVC